ncbi:MAG: hypothetical protein ACRENE_29335 [Polyangiaceae bacterium]
MSLSQDTMIELMSLADGELEGEAKLRVEKLVAESDEARRALDGLRAPHVALWLSDSLERRADKAGADRIADAVMGSVLTSASGTVPASGAALDGPEAPSSATVVRISETRRRPASRSGALVATFVGVAALAAGVALFVKSTARQGDQMPVASVGMPSVDMQRPPSEPSGLGVEVDDIDSPSRGISVFEISLAPMAGASVNAAAKAGSSVVVWIDDEGTK